MTAEEPNFEGHAVRECGEHRTVGSHRAWCYECHEWCYPRPDMACKGCELPAVRARLSELENAITWDVTCTNCARLLDQSYGEYAKGHRAGVAQGWDEGWEERDGDCSEPFSPRRVNPYKEAE